MHLVFFEHGLPEGGGVGVAGKGTRDEECGDDYCVIGFHI